MEKNNTIIISIATLIIGLVLGYSLGSKSVNQGTHIMPDGTVMSNDISGDMSHMMDDMMDGLKGKTGDEFDKVFLLEMIIHHQGAVLMAESALKNAKHQEIKDLSNAIISAQNKEITEMSQWYKNWYQN